MIQSRTRCSALCNQQPSCYTFDYDSTSRRCRLFEADLTTGSIISSGSLSSIVGTVIISPSLFTSIHMQSCQACQDNRYEICSTNASICECRPNTYWNGTVCALQLFENDTCTQIDACRADMNLTCAADCYGIFTTCSSATMFNPVWNMTGETVAGSTTGIAGIGADQLADPIGLAIDSSKTLYITDRTNNRVQKWLMGAPNGTTVAGLANGTSGSTVYYLSTPRGAELDSAGNVYIPDAANHRVVFWPVGASSCTVVAGNGTAGSANNQLNSPYGIAHDWNTGILYIADTFNHRIMSYASGASTGTMVIGGLGFGITQLYLPTGLYFDSSSNSLYIANSDANNIVRWVVNTTSWILVAGSMNGSAGATPTLLNYPRDVTLDSLGNVYVVDANNNRIQFFMAGQSDGTTIAGVTGIAGNTSTLLYAPTSVVVDSQFNIYVADMYNNRVQRFNHC